MMYEIEKGSGNEIGLIPRKVKIAYQNRDKAFERASPPTSIFKGQTQYIDEDPAHPKPCAPIIAVHDAVLRGIFVRLLAWNAA
jgi:hypothetical protein